MRSYRCRDYKLGTARSASGVMVIIFKSESILTRMVACEIAAQIWTSLNHFFATQTRAKVSQFRLMLQGTKKGSSSIMNIC